MTDPNYGNILYGWNLAGAVFGYGVLGLSTWAGMIVFMLFMNVLLLYLASELRSWHKYAKACETALRQRTSHAFTEDFAQRLQEEIDKRVADIMRKSEAGFTYRTKRNGQAGAQPPPPPPPPRPRNNQMKLFGLEWGYTQEQVTRSYRVLAKKYHPDLHGGKDAKIKQVNLAKEWLDQQIQKGLNK